jgi:hypothetical protein
MTPNDDNVGVATVEIDGKSLTFAGSVENGQAASNRALATSAQVLDGRAPYAPTLTTSYFADLRNAARGDAGAAQLLRLRKEQRDLTTTDATAGAEYTTTYPMSAANAYDY